MSKSMLALAALALAAAGWNQAGGGAPLSFKEERLLLEYSPSADEAVLLMEAESEEGLGRVEVRDPDGRPLLRLWTAKPQQLALSGLRVETLEASPALLLADYPEGLYDLRAVTLDGSTMLGCAALSHELLPAPVVTWPLQGMEGIPTAGLLVTWVPDPDAAGYHVVLEQDENDGLMVNLPPGAGELRVPDRLLRGGTETKLEVGAVGANGNITLAEVVFTTR
jgi:hypothetical protein